MANYTTKKELQEIIERAETLYGITLGNEYTFSGCKTNTDKYFVVSKIMLEMAEKEIKTDNTEKEKQMINSRHHIDYLDPKEFFTNQLNDTPFQVKGSKSLHMEFDNLLGDLKITGCQRSGKYKIKALDYGFEISGLFDGEAAIVVQLSTALGGTSMITAIYSDCAGAQFVCMLTCPWAEQDKAIAEAINRVFFVNANEKIPGVWTAFS